MSPRTRSFWLAGVVVLAVLAAYGWRAIAQAQAAAEARRATLAEAEDLLDRSDAAEVDPSRLVARLRELGDEDRPAVLLRARIEARRGRPERAMELLAPLAMAGASTEEARVAAAAWFEDAMARAQDRDRQRQQLQQAYDFALQAANAEGSVADQFLCWRLAGRLDLTAEAATHAAALRDQHPDSLQARTIAVVVAAREASAPATDAVGNLLAEWDEPPVELAVLHAALLLQDGELVRALEKVAAALAVAPGVFEVRNLAATAYHMAVLAAADEGVRARHAALRDAQIDWLDANAASDDARRPQWLSWRQQR
jgi:hypothetical protein